MPSTAHQPPPKMRANMAAADTNDKAVALTERSAEFVSFRWQQPSLPPTQNLNSAASPVLAAAQFSGSIAQIAANAVTTATFATSGSEN